MNLTNSGFSNLTNRAIYARETSIVNDIIRSSSLEVAQYRQQQLTQEAERSRLIAEASRNRPSNLSRFVRLPIGRAMVAVGRRIQGCAVAPKTEEINAGSAIGLAR